ncbi:SCO2524 family protein [Streptomyces sp. CA-179760]|uniref:SCO2524 family protein n=1 Tax=Streptomyces sp. CA-179760 TaxID=3240054 RepID=UPI003D93DD87
MQIKPRQRLLDIWQAIARQSFDEGTWNWGDLGGESSVADAERLLCLLYPATEIPAFRLDDPDTTERDVLRAMERAGGRLDLPASLVEVVGEFMRTHTRRDGSTPAFAGGYYFRPAGKGTDLTDEQRELGVVDSYSLSITLCLATLGFLKVYQTRTRRPHVQAAIAELRDATSNRLTAAMVSLLRSFTVSVYDPDSSQGEALTDLLGQGRVPQRHVVQRFRHRFKALRAVITESLVLGLDVHEGLLDGNRLFECGWAWGIVRDAPEVETDEPVGPQPYGIADPVPYLYFTVVALDGIEDLFSYRTLTFGLLDSEQQRLAEALRLRWEVTHQFWSGIARFDADRWPLEDIPWRTTGQRQESEYFSLSVTSLLVHDLMRRRATDDDLTRVVGVLERLADRARITSRVTHDDPMVRLHDPGVTMPLLGTERIGPPLRWTMTDFSAQLLKRTVQLRALSRDPDAHGRLSGLAEDILEHVWRRRIGHDEGAGLWGSWSFTERVVEVMVQAHHMYRQPPLRSPELTHLAEALLSEAAQLFGVEELELAPPGGGSRERALRDIELKLRRARELVGERPGTAYALALDVLGLLDVLAQARATARLGGGTC